jgi:hypothetical protein
MSAERVKRFTYVFDIVDMETNQHLMYVTIKADYWSDAQSRLTQWTYSENCPHQGIWAGDYTYTENQLQDVVLD